MKYINLKIKPYSLWLSYNMLNCELIKDMLPRGMDIADVKLSENYETAGPKLLFNCYNIESRWMKGSRLEILTIAKKEGNFHFVILDCLTNTGQWDPINRVKPPNSNIKFNYNQEILNYEVIDYNKKKLIIAGESQQLITIDKTFAVDSNYNCYFKNSEISVNLDFTEENVMKPVRKLKILNLTNDLWTEYRTEMPEIAFMHEQEMNFKASLPFY